MSHPLDEVFAAYGSRRAAAALADVPDDPRPADRRSTPRHRSNDGTDVLRGLVADAVETATAVTEGNRNAANVNAAERGALAPGATEIEHQAFRQRAQAAAEALGMAGRADEIAAKEMHAAGMRQTYGTQVITPISS